MVWWRGVEAGGCRGRGLRPVEVPRRGRVEAGGGAGAGLLYVPLRHRPRQSASPCLLPRLAEVLQINIDKQIIGLGCILVSWPPANVLVVAAVVVLQVAAHLGEASATEAQCQVRRHQEVTSGLDIDQAPRSLSRLQCCFRVRCQVASTNFAFKEITLFPNTTNKQQV